MNKMVMRAALTFVVSDEETIKLSASIDTAVSGEEIDTISGLRAMPIAQVSMVGEESGEVVKSMFMDRRELARTITELRAIYDAMDDCAQAVDRGWQRYRDAMRAEVLSRGDMGGGL
jgi:hypothetical protein